MKGERMNGRETEKEGLRKGGMGWYANVSLRESRRNGEIAAWKLQRTRDVYRDSFRIKPFLLSTLTNQPVC